MIPPVVYHVEGRGLVDVEARGLAYAFEAAPTSLECSLDGRPGRIVYARGAAIPRNVSEEYAWTPMEDLTGAPCHAGVSLGVRKSPAPTEADFRRARPLDGYRVRLHDGGDWLVPRALFYSPERGPVYALPGRITWREGEAVEVVTGRYRELCERALDVLLAATEDQGALLDDSLAVDALGLNYRVGRAEIAALGLLDRLNLREIVEAFCDLPGLTEVAGKKNSVPAANEVGAGSD
jgi:hypothetical protein